MPTYILVHNETGEEKETFVSISKMQEMTNPEFGEWTQKIGAPSTITHSGSIINKAGSGWKDLLGEIKKNSGRGNTINV